MPPLLTPSCLGGRWVIDDMLGEGAMGFVYRGHHDVLNKPVAIKVLKPELSRHEGIVARFLREARAASTIQSPHVVDIVDFGSEGGSHYIVMEFLDGCSLESMLEHGAVPLPLVYDLAIALAEGFAAAHDAGVVHRDIKPDNVVLLPHGDGTFACKIVDFGIAKVAEGACEARLTTPGELLGTPYYMSPEHCMGTTVDHRSDIYSLGAMLYELIVGLPPFDAESLADILKAQLTHNPTPLQQLVPECPDGLAATVARCMRKLPEERFATMHEVHAALQRARSEALGSTAGSRRSSIRPIAPLDLTMPPPQPSRRLHAVATALTALAAAAWFFVPIKQVPMRVVAEANRAVIDASTLAPVVAEPTEPPPPEKRRRKPKKARARRAAATEETPPVEAPTAPVARVPKPSRRPSSDVVDPWE